MIRSLILLIVLSIPTCGYCLTAFPGAVGMGANSIGGRSGDVYLVDTLSDDPDAGVTFREAAEASGPRYVLFKVSGIIDLNAPLDITNPYITIAGETSPGGILIAGWPVRIITHDLIMRHIRLRNGCQKCFAAGNCEDTGDTLSIYGYPAPYGATERQDAYNVIVDHCSISWGCDETVDLGAQDARVDNITISNCIIAEGVNDAHPEANHARGILMWGKRTMAGESIRVSFYNNLIMSFYSRLPLANYNVSFDFVNNVVYNFYSVLTPTLEPITGYTIEANIIHNYIKPGPLSLPAYPAGNGRETVVIGDGQSGHVTGTPYEMLYTVGNIGYTRQTQSGDDWIVSEGWSPTDLLSKDWQRTSPFPSPGGIAIATTTMSESYADTIANNAGATKPFRDSVDIRLVSEYTAGDAGGWVNRADVVYPVFPTDLPIPIDSDSDGMADNWEIAEFGNLDQTATSGSDLNAYDNLELYLHYLSGPPTCSGSCAPVNTIISPTSELTYQMNDVSVTIGGTSIDSDGTIASITWSCQTCTPTSGIATATDGALDEYTEDWTTGAISLSDGENIITVTAEDNDNNIGSDVLTITRSDHDPDNPDASSSSSGSSGGCFIESTTAMFLH